MARYSEGFDYLQLVDIIKVLHNIRGKTLSYNWSDGTALDFLQSGIGGYRRSYSFNVKEDTTYTTKHTSFQLNNCTFTDTGVVFGNNCKLDVCFDAAWYLNTIDKHKNKVSLNNVSTARTYVMYDEHTNAIEMSDNHFKEEYLFQLMTRYDIPYYEDMLLFNQIRTEMMRHDFHMSFLLDYSSEEDLKMFLDKVQEFLNDQN